MDENIAKFKEMGTSGGVDAAGQARMRGGGVFDEFAKTGGLSMEDRANMRSRATSTIPAFYRQMQEEANRGAAVQGGYGPGRAALAGRLARQQSAAGAEAALNAELGISDQVRQGRQWGGTNIAQSEAALQSLLSSNRLAGLRGASETEANMVNAIAGTRLGAANAGGGNEIGMQGLIQKGKMFGTQGLEGMAESAAARGAAGAAQSAADAKWQADFNRDSRMMGLEGMQSLYGMRPGEVEMYLDKNLQGRDLHYGQRSGGIDQRMQNNPKRDWVSTIGGLAGAFAGGMTGLGAIGVGAKAATSDRTLKTNIEEVTDLNIVEKFKSLPIFTWEYKSELGERHLGPMAQDMKEIFGVGDGKSIALVDVMGLLMLLGKAVARGAA
jgi:hypothetical protein